MGYVQLNYISGLFEWSDYNTNKNNITFNTCKSNKKKYWNCSCLLKRLQSYVTIKITLQDLVSHSSVQYLLNEVWFGGMKQDTNLLRVATCCAMPALVPLIIKFEPVKEQDKVAGTCLTA